MPRTPTRFRSKWKSNSLPRPPISQRRGLRPDGHTSQPSHITNAFPCWGTASPPTARGPHVGQIKAAPPVGPMTAIITPLNHLGVRSRGSSASSPWVT